MKEHMPRAVQNIVIVRNAYSWQYGGAEQFAYNLAAVMKDEGIRATVVSRVPELLRHCRQDGIATFRNIWLKNETHRKWMPAYYLLLPILVGQYVGILLKTRADLLVVSSRDDQIFGTMAAKLMGVPVVWFDHADMKHIVASRFRFLAKSYYWALRNADKVVMTSQAERAKVTENFPTARQTNFVTILNGGRIRPGKALDRPKDTKIVAYAGRLEKDKGIFDLAEAAASIVKRVPNVEFWLAGKGPGKEEMAAKIAHLGIADHFKFLGHLDNVQDLLLAADLFVYPTHHDAAPLAPVEALLAGLPVVASRVGGIPEMIPAKAGVLVTPHEPQELADTITELLTDKAKLASLQAGAKEAGRNMEFSVILKEKYLPLFNKLAGKEL